MELRAHIAHINEFLSTAYGTPMRLSVLLAELGFSEGQLRVLRKGHIEPIITSFVSLVKLRLITSRDGDRMYYILCRRFALDGAAPETLESLGKALGISRERVRQIEQKDLRRGKSKGHRRVWEAGLRDMVTNLVGQPEEAVSSLRLMQQPHDRAPLQTDSETKTSMAGEEQDNAYPNNLVEMMTEVLEAVPEGLSTGMLAHVLFGSQGPVVDRLVDKHSFRGYGSLKKKLGYPGIRALITEYCQAHPLFEVVAGKIRLRTAA